MSSWLLRISAVAVVAASSLLLHQGVGAQAPGPNISSVVVVSSPDDSASYLAGENIELSVQFTSGVRVAGSPVLAVNIGGTTRDALFESVRGSEALFAYSVLDADFDAPQTSQSSASTRISRWMKREASGVAMRWTTPWSPSRLPQAMSDAPSGSSYSPTLRSSAS